MFEHPPGFANRGGGYIYLCIPWLAQAEWHAFSLYEHPTLPNHSTVCIAAVGDWTKNLYSVLSGPSLCRPGWLYGPFPSPFSSAATYHNLVFVATGIGVTPTLGAIKHLNATRNVNVVWIVRDANLVEYFLRNVA